MTIDEVTLHNFGAYKGKHAVTLTPLAAEKPIILFGGLNGAGKTTLLDGMLLALHGRHARCSNRGVLAYETYLTRCINRDVSPGEGAAVQMIFRHTIEGRENLYRVSRSWVPSGPEPGKRWKCM